MKAKLETRKIGKIQSRMGTPLEMLHESLSYCSSLKRNKCYKLSLVLGIRMPIIGSTKHVVLNCLKNLELCLQHLSIRTGDVLP